MADWQTTFDSFNISEKLAVVIGMFQTRKKTKDKDYYSFLKRSHDVCLVFASALNEANINNTSLNVFHRAARALETISMEIQKPTSDSIDVGIVNTQTDILLECIPAMAASNENPRLIHKKASDFETMVANNRGVIDEVVRTFRRDLDEQLKAVRDNPAMDELRSNAESVLSNAEAGLERINNIEAEGKKLATLLGGKVLKSDFQSRADTEKSAAKRWTIGTIAFAGISAIALVAVFFLHFKGLMKGMEQDYQLIVSQVLMTATFGLLAKWCSKRANVHLLEEARYHRLAVNMATVNSFIKELNEDARGKVISALAISNFSDPAILSEMSSEYETPITEILKTSFDKIKDKA